MSKTTHPSKWAARTFALIISAALMAGPALADKPEGKGKGKGKGHDREERVEQRHDGDHDRRGRDHARITPREGAHFVDKHRTHVRNYYADTHRRGHCPPGLAKKNNGCMPPGHAKKWHVGQPLPRDVIYYDLPPRLVQEIGPPPLNHRYVRVAADILLIAIGTGMVIDAIQDLSGL